MGRQRSVRWSIELNPGERRALSDPETVRLRQHFEKLKASVRARDEHRFHVVRNIFGHARVRYCAMARNRAQLHTFFCLENLKIWAASSALYSVFAHSKSNINVSEFSQSFQHSAYPGGGQIRKRMSPPN